MVIQGIASPTTYSHLKITDSGTLEVQLQTFGTSPVQGNLPLLSWAKDKNMYSAFQQAWQSAINTESVKGRTAMRSEKEYPNMFNYLGWCSWEQYRRKISSDLMVDAIKKIEKSPVPVRWVLVDDGHQDQTGVGMNDSRMLSFDAHPETFPQGFKPIMDQKSEKIKWMGIWHAMNGQWQGLNPDHSMKELNPHMMKLTRKVKNEPMPFLMPKGDTASSWMFYKSLIKTTCSDHGFDFVKIDNQSRQIAFYEGQENAVQVVATHAQSLEKAAKQYSKGLINCFCTDMLSLMNTKYSAVSRVSVDYLANNEEKAKSHLLQSYQNTLWMGQAIWPDHDMFHSSDKFCGRMMAVSKAVSGAPIYLSDAPVDFVDALISPLCTKEGELFRPLAPAVPLPESAVLSALEVAQAYRVVAPLPNGAAAYIAYNLVHPSKSSPIKARFSTQDYTQAGSFIQPSVAPWQVPAEGLVYYDWYNQTGGVLNKYVEFDLTGFADRFVQMSPVKQGWSVIGRSDVYLSAAAVKSIQYSTKKLSLQFVESGPLVVYNKSKVSCKEATKITNIGNGLWLLDIPKGTKNMEVTVSVAE